MKPTLLAVSLIMAIAFGACSSKPKSPYRAFQQQDDADLVVEFWHWDSWTMEKPLTTDGRYLVTLTKQELLDKLAHLKSRRQFAVVIFDKRVAPAGKGASMEELVSFFRKLGFRRIVFQQAQGDKHPDGLPILRDTAERK